LANATFLNENGELFVSGNIHSNESHVSKFDTAGNVIWSKTFENSDISYYTNNQYSEWSQIDNFLKLQDSTYLLTRNVVAQSTNLNQTYLVKFDENGALNWSKHIHQNNASNHLKSFTLEMNNGKLLHVNSVDGSNELAILRFTTAGMLEVNISLSNSEETKPVAFIKDTNSAYIISSNYLLNATYIIHIDEMGALIDSKKIADFTAFDGIVSGGNLHLIGTKNGYERSLATFQYDSTTINFTDGLYQADNCKLRCFNNRLYLISSIMNFGSALTCDLMTNTWKEVSFHSGVVDLHEYDSIRLLSIGNGPQFGIKAHYEPQFGISLFDSNSLTWTCNNGFYPFFPTGQSSDTLQLTNFSNVSAAPFILGSLSLAWTDALLAQNDGCVEFVSGLDENSPMNQVQISPNPASESFLIEFTEPIHANFQICSMNGQIVSTDSIDGFSKIIQISQFESGMYYMLFREKNGAVFSKKIVIQH